MKDEELLAIADPKDQELVRFSVGETFDANVKVLQAVVPRPQSTGPRDTYIVRRVCQGPPFGRKRPRVAMPPTWDPPAVVVGDKEGNTFMVEWYCPQVTIRSFWGGKKNNTKRKEHATMFRGCGRGTDPKHFFSGFSTSRPSRSRRAGKSVVCPHGLKKMRSGRCLASSSYPLCTRWVGRCAKFFWDKGDSGDVRVQAHQHAEEVYQRGEHLRLRKWSAEDVDDYEERLRECEGKHVFLGGQGVEGAEEEEGGKAEEEEGDESEGEGLELSISVYVDPAPPPQTKPEGRGGRPPPKTSPQAQPCLASQCRLGCTPPNPRHTSPPKPPAMAVAAGSLNRRTSMGRRRSWWRVRAMARSGRSRTCITSRGGG